MARDHQVGVARYVINSDGRSCEFAVVVERRGRRARAIGSRLMKALMNAARGERAVESIEGIVLADNKPMLQLMADLGFRITHLPDDASVVQVDRPL